MVVNILKVLFVLSSFAGNLSVPRAGSPDKSHLRGERRSTLMISVVLET